jgi:hypothetical protein
MGVNSEALRIFAEVWHKYHWPKGWIENTKPEHGSSQKIYELCTCRTDITQDKER